MHAMQYEITLPADYDMRIIHDRVATKGHLLDEFPGLGIKAYLIRERADGSPVNQYAPFYLWATPEGMNSFLWGPGFQGIVNDFGRPEVQHWTGLGYEEGPASGSVATLATRRRERLREHDTPADAVQRALAEHRRVAAAPGVVAAAVAVDPRRWELLHFTLWAEEAPAKAIDDTPGHTRRPWPEDSGERFRVLRLCTPDRSKLPRGRQW